MEAVERELSRLPGELASGVLAATALELGRQLDEVGNSATSKANCAQQLRETLADLRGLAPVERKGSQLDEIAARRQRRKAASG